MSATAGRKARRRHVVRCFRSVNASATLDAIRARDSDILEDEDLYHETMIATLTRRREGNQPIVDRLHTAFSVALLGLLAQLSGLALAAALAS